MSGKAGSRIAGEHLLHNYFRYSRLMEFVERPFSDLLRQPNDVIAELVDRDVLLRRRSAPALRLSRADRVEDRTEAFEVLAQLLRNLAEQNPDALGSAASDAFAWMMLLPERDQMLFVDQLTQTLLAVASVDSYWPVAQLLREWKATAEIHADPLLARDLLKPIEATGDTIKTPTA